MSDFSSIVWLLISALVAFVALYVVIRFAVKHAIISTRETSGHPRPHEGGPTD